MDYKKLDWKSEDLENVIKSDLCKNILVTIVDL